MKNEKIIFKSQIFSKILDLAKKAAISDAPVLIYGESGTGKEIIADYIHKQSNRSKQNIVKINCVALPENLFESELFGYEAHAFTGALKQKKGFFELADKGTIFLDEIGEIPISLQPKLLRVLQEKEIIRIGGHTPIKVDFRIISASNKNLKKLVENGQFREDLYYRLNVIEINIPPLRERKDDIEPLLYFFLNMYTKKYNKKILDFEPEVLQCLKNYPWYGNVRELKNLIERLVIFETNKLITKEYLPNEFCAKARICQQGICNNSINNNLNQSNLIDEVEKNLIETTLLNTKGVQKLAALKLGIHRNTLKQKIKKYGIDITKFKMA